MGRIQRIFWVLIIIPGLFSRGQRDYLKKYAEDYSLRRIRFAEVLPEKIGNINLFVTPDYEAMSRLAADRLAGRMQGIISQKGKVVVCLATGGTMERLYEILRTEYKDKIDWSKVVTFNLDEYVGLKPDNVNSYRYYMDTNLFNHVGINKKNIHFLNGMATDLDKAARDYEEEIKSAGGIDIMLLGIGRNGHIAFNMPGSDFYSRTRVVELDEMTRQDNARFFNGDINRVPKQALTVGMATITESREILLLASGEAKKEIIYNTIFGPCVRENPASILQWHNNTTFILDQLAFAKRD